jgi:hypothetical protein
MKTKVLIGLALVSIPAILLVSQHKNYGERPSDLRDAVISDLQNAVPAGQQSTVSDIPAPNAVVPAPVAPGKAGFSADDNNFLMVDMRKKFEAGKELSQRELIKLVGEGDLLINCKGGSEIVTEKTESGGATKLFSSRKVSVRVYHPTKTYTVVPGMDMFGGFSLPEKVFAYELSIPELTIDDWGTNTETDPKSPFIKFKAFTIRPVSLARLADDDVEMSFRRDGKNIVGHISLSRSPIDPSIGKGYHMNGYLYFDLK